MLLISIRSAHAVPRPTARRAGPASWVALSLGLWLLGMAPNSWARDFRVNMIPNGQVFGCANCHVSAGGGGALNPFGLTVRPLTGGSAVAFWSAALAAQDSDGDGFTNGEELGDPEGTGMPIPGAQVTNPGNPNSRPTIPPIVLAELELLSGGEAVRLTWTGGRGPFLVQRKSVTLGKPEEWEDLAPATQERSVTLEFGGATRFFRVVGQVPAG